MVERVHGLPELEHHVVRDVDDEPQRPHAAELEPLRHPVGRRTVLDGRHDAGGVPRALLGVLDGDGDFARDVDVTLHEADVGLLHLAMEDRAELARKSDDGKGVRAVPGDLDLEDGLRLLAGQDVAEERARGRLRRELHDSVVVAAGQVQLGGRAAHAEGVDAPHAAFLDLEPAVGDDRADLGERGLHAGARVGRAADDLQSLRAVVHLADVEVVRVGMRLAFDDFRDDEVVVERLFADGLDRLDLQARAGELLGELLRVYVVDLYVFVKPTEGQLHLSSLLLSVLL